MPLEHENITRLRVSIDARQPLAPEVAEWLLGGFDFYLGEKAKGKNPSVCQAWKLGKRGYSPAHQSKLKERNRHLQTAWEQTVLKPVLPWTQAGILEKEILRFETGTWPRVKNNASPPDRLNAVQRSLFLAKKTGAELPNSRDGILKSLGIKQSY